MSLPPTGEGSNRKGLRLGVRLTTIAVAVLLVLLVREKVQDASDRAH